MWEYRKKEDDLCLAPIIWHFKEIQGEMTDEGMIFKSLPPKPKDGYWIGYYIEVVFPGDTIRDKSDIHFYEDNFVFTTPGWTWPDTLPFPDCEG